jgi:hypothetical protein
MKRFLPVLLLLLTGCAHRIVTNPPTSNTRTIVLHWAMPVTDTYSYTIYKEPMINSTFVVIANKFNGTTFRDEGVSRSATPCYKVTATTATGITSQPSEVVCAPSK